MNAEQFWEVIGNYNTDTLHIQVVLTALLVLSVILAYKEKFRTLPKVMLGIVNIFIGIVFFLYYGTEPIQTYFAAPLYIIIGIIFGWEGIRHRNDRFNGIKGVKIVLLGLVILYPVISFLLGNTFPEIVLYIMPCPIISFSIVIYLCYDRHNKLLITLLIIWGLTGIKAFLFNALEDTILLLCGIYAIVTLIRKIRSEKHLKSFKNQ